MMERKETKRCETRQGQQQAGQRGATTRQNEGPASRTSSNLYEARTRITDGGRMVKQTIGIEGGKPMSNSNTPKHFEDTAVTSSDDQEGRVRARRSEYLLYWYQMWELTSEF